MDRETQIEIEKIRIDAESRMAVWHAEDLRKMEQWKREWEWSIQSTGWSIGFAKLALQGLLTISGGAVIALSAFIGNIWSDKCHFGEAEFFLYFVWAALLAVACSGVSYLAQLFFSQSESCYNKIGIFFQVAAIFLFVSGLVMFGLGGYEAYGGLTKGSMLICLEDSK